MLSGTWTQAEVSASVFQLMKCEGVPMKRRNSCLCIPLVLLSIFNLQLSTATAAPIVTQVAAGAYHTLFI